MFVSNLLYCIISSNKSWDRKKRPATSNKLISNVHLPNFLSVFLAKEGELQGWIQKIQKRVTRTLYRSF